jgi:hypothetical protein
MKLEVTISSTIIGFPNDQINLNTFKDIEKKLESICKSTEEINKIIIFVNMTSQGNVAILKRSRYYRSTKELELSSLIQIPENTIIDWGINKKYYLPRPPLKISGFTKYELNFQEYSTLQEYVDEAANLILNHFLKFGIKFHENFVIEPKLIK